MAAEQIADGLKANAFRFDPGSTPVVNRAIPALLRSKPRTS
jgi:hypothetical protein